ncbi:MAG: phosphoribosylformylglycinamidine synthase [Oscillospiraceae bacterium]|nr:phosphoribosylformylglycinamidine synthase [Oscillospiraceae bacterium]
MERVLIEKREPFRFDERDMLREIQTVLGISSISNVRIFNGYDIESVDNIEQAIGEVFSEAGQDIVHYDPKNKTASTADIKGAAFVFAVTAAVGQYDQREDFAMQLLRISNPGSKPKVRSFKQIALYGDISQSDFDKIKSYYINPLEMREISLAATEPIKYTEPCDIEVINGFVGAGDKELAVLASKYGIAMEPDNLKICRDYFIKEKREPTVTEMKVLSTYWSDHCRHSTFLSILEDVRVEENQYSDGLKRARARYDQAKEYVYGDAPRPLCLMDIATMQMKKQKKNGALADMELSDEVNACSIEAAAMVDGKPVDYIIMFKNETHNHPTEMEPFGGASTCLGGGIRDPLSGRAFVYGAIRLTGSADPREAIGDTLAGKLPQRKITQTAANGYSSYGNQIGLASGHLIEVYDPGFKAKRMECGALVAAVPKDDITRGKPRPGDVIVLVGGATGRDGCGGATGSSAEQDDDALIKGGAEVQKGNPVIERNIVRLFRKPHVSRMIKKCNDFGAGGVCVAVGELADSLKIDLDKVPVKYPGLDGTELAISESQERMAVLLDKKDMEAFLQEADAENLLASKLADVTSDGKVRMTWRGTEISCLDREFLNSGGVRRKAKVVVNAPDWDFPGNAPQEIVETGCKSGTLEMNIDTGTDGRAKTQKNIEKTWLLNLSDINVCSKKGIAGRFDYTAANAAVFAPFGGANQATPEQGLAMRLPLMEGETDFGTLMTVGYNPALGYKSPFHAALYAVVESVVKIAAMGGDYRKVRLSFQEYFESLTAPESWGKPYAALMGAFLAQDELGIPAIGGKDSMSGTYKDINVPPSLISFAVVTADMSKLVSRSFKKSKSVVYLLETPIDESGIPDFDVLKRNMAYVYELAQCGRINAASVVGVGGIAAAVSEMAFGNHIGFDFDSGFDGELFAPMYASMILETDIEIGGSSAGGGDGIFDNLIKIGTTTDKNTIEIAGASISLEKAKEAWESALESVFPIYKNTEGKNKADGSAPSCDCDSGSNSHSAEPQMSNARLRDSNSKPRVLIPIFPGSNGEYELERQFKKAGANVSTFLFRTLSAQAIKDSYAGLTAAVNAADILAIPSGMSAGAEPDGSAKLIALILRNPDVKKAVNGLVTERGGLVIGLGEGFKALLKTGMIQSGKIMDNDQGDIVLAKYPHNQYHTSIEEIIIEQTDSPWVYGLSSNTLTVPVSGQDGALHMSCELYDKYLANGQIAASFTSSAPSRRRIAALVSENGRVLGMIPLVDRLEAGLYANVFKAGECKIFKNAAEYFSRQTE